MFRFLMRIQKSSGLFWCYVSVVLIFNIWIIVSSKTPLIKSFLSSNIGSSKQQLEKYYDEHYGSLYQRISFVKEMTPPDSLIILPPMKNEFIHLGNRSWASYLLFPRITAHQSDLRIKDFAGPIYQVKLNGFAPNAPILQEWKDNESFALLLLKQAKKESSVKDVRDFTEIKITMNDLFAAFIKFTFVLLAGMLLVLGCGGREISIGLLLSSSLLAGTLISTILHLGFNLIGHPLTGSLETIILFLLAVSGVVLFQQSETRKYPITFSISFVEKFLIILVICFFLGIFIKTYNTPIISWDGCAIWGAKAKAFFAFYDLKYLFSYGAHPQYPPLLPIFMGQMAVGGEGVVQLISPLFLLCLYLIMFNYLGQAFSLSARIVLPLIVLTSPIFFMHSYRGESALALSVFLTLALALLSNFSNTKDPQDFRLFCLILCGLVMVRPEGFLYASLMLVIAGLNNVLITIKKRSLWLLISPLGIYIGWLIFYSFYSNASLRSFVFGSIGGVESPHISLLSIFNLFYILKMSALFIISTINPVINGLIPLIFTLLFIIKPMKLLYFYPIEIYFISIVTFCWFVINVFVVPLWGDELVFMKSVPRYNMVLIPTLFLILTKELYRYFQSRKLLEGRIND